MRRSRRRLGLGRLGRRGLGLDLDLLAVLVLDDQRLLHAGDWRCRSLLLLLLLLLLELRRQLLGHGLLRQRLRRWRLLRVWRQTQLLVLVLVLLLQLLLLLLLQ